MPKARLSYDGWLNVPAAARRRLGLSAGQQLELELELVGGAMVLRPVGVGGPATAEVPPAAAGRPEEAAGVPAPAGKRGSGRPRKVSAVSIALPSNLKTRGAARGGE